MPVIDRFWSKVDKRPDGCWLWTGGLCKGYGQFRPEAERRSHVYAHRFAYELLVGPIPTGLQIDHLCRVRHCVNPGHLEPVTQQENRRRGVKAQTHCKNGHAVTKDSHYDYGFGRRCKLCHHAAMRRYMDRRDGAL